MRFARSGLTLIAFLLIAHGAGAQQIAGRPVDEIVLRGLDRVSEQFVRSQLESKTGEPVNPNAVARDIRRLFELGYFTRIDVDADVVNGRLVLTYLFEEEKVIESLRIYGNKKVKTRALKQALTWHEGDSFYAEGWAAERDAILDVYAERGFLNATVDVVVEEISPSRVRIAYFIREGRKARIRDLRFEGNEVLSDRRLKKIVKTKPRRWLFIGGKYDEQKFEADLRNIVDAYGDVGRMEAEVVSTDFDYDGNKLKITIYLDEGPEYTVDDMTIAGNYVYDNDELNDIVEVRAGEVHDRGQVIEDAAAIQKLYTDSGYINARVTPRVTLDRNEKTTTIVHDVREGDLKYIREVNITGNTVTRDDVIRRRLVLHPGERFDGDALRRSQNRVNALRYFDSARFTVQDVDENPVFTDLLLDVEEGQTGNFNFGGGFSTDESYIAFAELSLRNFDITDWPTFSGGGQQFSVRTSLGDRRQFFNVSFTDPEIGGIPISFGLDIFNESYRSRGGSDYEQETRGAQLRFGKALSEFTTIRASIAYRDVEIDNIDQFVLPRYDELLEPDGTLSTTFSLARDTTDDFRDPTRGWENVFYVTLAGLADNEFVKLGHDTTVYRKLTEEGTWVVSQRLRSDAGWVFGDREFIPLQERLFAGGSSTIRGYETRDVGPKVLDTSGDTQAIGGELRFLSNTEVKYKINDIFRLYGFLDGGAVFLEPSDFDTDDFRFGAGIGIGVEIPGVGPMRLDYGIPLNPDDDQGNGELHFSSGFSF